MQFINQIAISLAVFFLSYFLMNYFFEPVKMQIQIKKRILILLQIYKADILSFKINDYSNKIKKSVHNEFISLSAEFLFITSIPFFNTLSEIGLILNRKIIIRVCQNLNLLSYFPYMSNENENVENLINLIKSIEKDLKISIMSIDNKKEFKQ